MNEAKNSIEKIEEIHLRDYFKVLQKRKAIIALFFLITIITVTIVTLRMVPIYEASTQVLVEKNQSSSLVGRGFYDGYDPEFYETQHQLIMSQNVARKVVKLLNLESTYDTYFPKKDSDELSLVQTTKKNIKNWLKTLMPATDNEAVASAMPVTERSRSDELADEVRGGISVSLVSGSKLLNISFQSENPEFSRVVANSIADAYKEEIMDIHANSSGYALKWMTKKAAEEKRKLAEAEYALQQYMKKQDIVTIEDKITILPQQLSTLTNKLSEAETAKNNLEHVYNQVQEVRATKGDLGSLSIISSNREMQSIVDAVHKAEQQISELNQKYGYKHPVMVEAKNELKDLKRQMAREIKQVEVTLKHDYEVAVSQEGAIKSSLERVKLETMALNEKLTEYRILKRDVDTNRVMYEALVMQAKEKSVTENTQKINVWMTQVAETPIVPIKPSVKKNILLGMILGLFGGVGVAFFIEYLDNTIKDPEDTEKRFGYSVIGVVEMLDKQNGDTYALENPESAFAESFKSLRTSLLLSAAGRPPKRVQVTSMSPQEGKSTTSLNLGYSLAQTDRSVVLIDADLRRPRQHKAHMVDNSFGLSTYLSGASSELDIKKIGDSNLSLISSGPIPPNPSELLGSSRFGELLDMLDKQFDLVIVDTPPILSATDSLLISKEVDGAIIVTKFASTTYDRLKCGLKALEDVNGNIKGIVINGMDMKKSNYYSYYGYYQYYSADKAA